MGYTGSLAYRRTVASGKLDGDRRDFHAALHDMQFVHGWPNASMNEIARYLRQIGHRPETYNGCGTVMAPLRRSGCVWFVGRRSCDTSGQLVKVYVWTEWNTIQPEPEPYLTTLRRAFQEYAQHRCPTCGAHQGRCAHQPCPGLQDATVCTCGFTDIVNELFIERSMKS